MHAEANIAMIQVRIFRTLAPRYTSINPSLILHDETHEQRQADRLCNPAASLLDSGTLQTPWVKLFGILVEKLFI